MTTCIAGLCASAFLKRGAFILKALSWNLNVHGGQQPIVPERERQTDHAFIADGSNLRSLAVR